jgi:hypothetical protein
MRVSIDKISKWNDYVAFWPIASIQALIETAAIEG